jgi:TatD DNase family protein
MFIVDSHCHLDYDSLAADIDGVLERARSNDVRLVVSIGTRVRKFSQILRLAEQYPEVWCTVGTHPHNAHEELDVTVRELVDISRHPKIIGIGEAGLDYHYDLSPREAQAQGFRTHIAAARESGLPLVIHSREAEEDTAAILEEEMQKGAFLPLLHCFTSRPELAQRGLALGGYVSFSGILTYKNAPELREAAAQIPLNRLLVETDAPYLSPVPFRGKPNEPSFVVKTLEQLAAVKNVAKDEMARVTTENFFRLFAKARRPNEASRAA